MLPDLWRMADRRVRARADVPRKDADGALLAVLRGIDHHLEVDLWFHRAPVFLEGERLVRHRFRAAATSAPKLGLFAHATWEMLLDGELLRREGLEPTLDALREGFDVIAHAAQAAASAHHFDSATRSAEERAVFDARMHRIFTELARGPWIAGYRDGAGVVERLEGLRARFALPAFTARDRDELAAALDELVPWTEGALDAILSP